MSHHRLTLVAALAATTLFAACGDKTSDNDSSASDGASTTAAATTRSLGTTALLTDDDTVYSDGADWFRTSAFEGDGQDVFNPCAQESLKGTGANQVVRADFELRNTDDPSVPVTGDHFTQVAGQYDDAAAAKAAYDKVAGWLTDCDPRPEAITTYKSFDPRPVTVDGATAQVIDSQYGPVPKEVDPYGDEAHFMETGLVLRGDRLTVLTSVIIGQDYNFVSGTPVEQMLVPAGERLGNDGGDTSTDGETSSSPSDTSSGTPSDAPSSADAARVLPGFDLTAGMLENDDQTPVKASRNAQGVGPLAYCGTKVNLAKRAEERLAANASGPEYGEGREVLVYADKATAQKAVADLLAAARACPEQDYSGTTWQHAVKKYDAPVTTQVITRTYETGGQVSLGLDTFVVSQKGRVVVLASRSSEGSKADTDTGAKKLIEDLESVYDQVIEIAD